MFQYVKILLVSCGLSLLIHSTFVRTQVISSQSASSLGGLPVGTVSRFGLNGDTQFLTSLGNAKVGTSERQILPFVPIPWWLTAPNFYYRPRAFAVRPVPAQPTIVRPAAARPTVVRPAAARPTIVRPAAARPTVVRPVSRPTGGVGARAGGIDAGGLVGGVLSGVAGSLG